MEDNAYKLHIPQGKPWQQMAENVTASVVLAQQSEKVWHATLCSFAPAIELHLQSKDVQMCMKVVHASCTSLRASPGNRWLRVSQPLLCLHNSQRRYVVQLFSNVQMRACP